MASQPKPGGGRASQRGDGGRRGSGGRGRGRLTDTGGGTPHSSSTANPTTNNKDSSKKTESSSSSASAAANSGRGSSRGGAARAAGASGGGGGRGAPNNRASGAGRDSSVKKESIPPKDLAPQPKQSAAQLQAAKELAAQQTQERLAAKSQADAAAKLKAEQRAEERRHKRQQDDALAKLKQSRELIQSVMDTCQRHADYRVALAPETLAASRSTFESTKKTLKTDLKKCTAFCKKVKSGAAWGVSKAELLKEATSLNLTRYVDELVANVLESQPKASEIDTLAAFCVCLQERYPEFMPSLLQGLKDGLLNGQNVKTKRLNLRILTEFYLNGLLPESKLLVKVVAEAAGAKENSANDFDYVVQDGGLLVAFAKSAGYEIFGRLPTAVQQSQAFIESSLVQLETGTADQIALLPPKELLEEASTIIMQMNQAMALRNVDEDVCRILTNHCLGAYQFMAGSLVQTHNKLLKLEKRCEQDRILSGSLPEAREKGLADARMLKENLEKSVEALADALDQPIPHLEEGDDGAQDGGGGLEVWTKGGEGGENDFGPFGDEETRSFYCDIPDLLATIPPALLGMTPEQVERRKEENKKRHGAEDEQEIDDDGTSDLELMTEAELNASEGASLNAADDGEGGTAAEEDNKDTPHYRLMTLLEQELPECHQRAQIDELTERFCTNHGSSKNARKRLTRTLFLVPRNRLDLLPYYSRMAATVDRIWPDVAEALVTELEQQFHGQTKFKKNQNIESRFRTARYLGELTKFSVAPPIVFLRCLRRCLDDFTGSNVDVMCCLLESGGRFIYRLNAQANARLSSLMEITTRLSKAKNLDERSQSLINAALYSVNPPPAGPRKRAKEYPPLETYLRHLLLVELDPSENSIVFVSKQLVRLPWSDPSYNCGALVTKIMLKACRKGRYKTIQAIAAVAERIRTQRRAGEVTVRLIDLVVEELRWGLEHPDFRDQQRVLTYARLLGELYCCNQVSGHMVLQQLYDFINIGHEIPFALRQACQKLAENTSDESVSESAAQLPVYNSATGISQTIQEDEELEDSELIAVEQTAPVEPKPVAVSEHSVFDPRVPTATDPPNSPYRIKLVCTMLDSAAKTIVTRSNLPRLKGFLAAFQRYLFIKSTLPVEVEFSLLDTFDVLDSRWKQVTKTQSSKQEEGFPRYSSWIDAHNATVAVEESGQLDESKKADAFLEAKSSELALDDSLHDDETNSQLDDDDESIDTAKDSMLSEKAEGDLISEGAGTAERSNQSFDEDSDDESVEDEGEFDEEAYMRQLEEEAFERELRKVTMDAIEKGKNLSRKQVAEYMPSGSQISMVKKKTIDPTPAESVKPPIPSTINALGGKMGVNFQLLKKGNKGKVEVKALVVPADTQLAQAACRKDDEASRERDAIKQRVLRYEAESANAEFTGGNVYLEQEKLVKIRNRLSMEEIDKNFGTSGGNLRQNATDTKPKPPPATSSTSQPGRASAGGRGGPGRGRGRSNTGGRTLFS